MGRLLKTYLTSLQLKKTIVRRSTDLEIPFRYICHDLGIEYRHFMATYINGGGENCEISEKDFEKMLEILGISVRFQFVISDTYRPDEIRDKLKKQYYSFTDGFKQPLNEEEAGTPSD